MLTTDGDMMVEQIKVSALKKSGIQNGGKIAFCIRHCNRRSECIPCYGRIPWQSKRYCNIQKETSKGFDS